MAIIVATASGGDREWSTAATWVGGSAPGAGDTATLDATSGDVTVSGVKGAVAGINMAGYTGTLTITTGSILTSSGHLTYGGTVILEGTAQVLCAGNLTYAAGTTFTYSATSETVNSSAGACAIVVADGAALNVGNLQLIVGAGQECTLPAAWKAANLDFDTGVYIGNNGVLTCAGSFDWNAACSWFGNYLTKLTFSGTAARDFRCDESAGKIPEVDFGSATVDITGPVWMRKITGAASAAITSVGSQIINIYVPATGFWNYQGSCSAAVKLWPGANMNTGLAINLTNKNLEILNASGAADFTLTATGDISLGTGDLYLYTNSAGRKQTLDMAGKNLAMRDAYVGWPAAVAKSGELLCGEGVIAARNIQGGHADNTNLLALESCYMTAATITGTNLDSVTNSAARVRGATITDVQVTGTELDARGCTDSGTPPNDNIDFTALAMAPTATLAKAKRFIWEW